MKMIMSRITSRMIAPFVTIRPTGMMIDSHTSKLTSLCWAHMQQQSGRIQLSIMLFVIFFWPDHTFRWPVHSATSTASSSAHLLTAGFVIKKTMMMQITPSTPSAILVLANPVIQLSIGTPGLDMISSTSRSIRACIEVSGTFASTVILPRKTSLSSAALNVTRMIMIMSQAIRILQHHAMIATPPERVKAMMITAEVLQLQN